ncbi:MAG: hypothetical protein IT334_09515 [Thermomicrobiales bacterium]|nr:hypothetical protein [Thermomicrobiales bacterium]
MGAASLGLALRGCHSAGAQGMPEIGDGDRIQLVAVVFAEPQFTVDLLEVVVAETGIAIGELLTDSFAGRVDSYLQLMRFNRDSLVRYLMDEWDDRC